MIRSWSSEDLILHAVPPYAYVFVLQMKEAQTFITILSFSFHILKVFIVILVYKS